MRNRSFILSLSIALLLSAFFALPAKADKLCQSNYTGSIGSLGSKTVKVSIGTVGTNMYRIVFESDFAMTGSDTYVNTSYNDNLKIEESTMTILNDGKLIYFDIPSTSAPTFKNNIMVKTSQGNYTITGVDIGSIDWSQTTAECPTLVGECAYVSNELILNVTTNGMVSTFELSHSSSNIIGVNNVNPVNLNGGVTSDLTNGGWTISDGKATKTITWSTLPTGNVITRVDIYANITGPIEKGGTFNSVDVSCASSEEEDCDEPSETTVWFLNTNGWADNATYAYMWKGGTSNASYPGEVMTPTSIFNKDSKKLYYVTFAKDTYSKVKFNCNSNNSGCYTSDLDIQPNKCYNFASGWVTKPSAVHVAADVNSYSTSADPMSFICNTLDYEARVTFSTTGNHAFKIVVTDGSTYWYGCVPGSTPTASFSNYAFSTSGGNMPFTADVVGDYYFKFNYATQTVSVTYPPYMTSASLYSKTATTAVINVVSTRGTKYHIVDSSNGVNQTLTPTDGKITVTGLTPGTQYTFTVTAMDANDTESANNVVMSSFYTLPTISSAAYDSRTYNTITLSVSGTGATQYKVTNTSPSVDQTITPSDGKITVTSLTPNTSYSFTVWAVNAAGETSTESINVSAVKTTPQMTSATVYSKTSTTVVLSVASTGGSAYKVTNTSGVEYTLSSATPTDGKITVTGLTVNTEYTFRVYALSSDVPAIQSSNYIDVTARTYPNVRDVVSGYDDCQMVAVHTSGDEYTPAGMLLANWGVAASGAGYTDGSSKKAYKVNTNSDYYYGLYFGSTWTGVPTTLVDASSQTKLHIEFWSAEAQTFNFNVLSYYSSANHVGTAQSVSTTGGTWLVKEYSLSDFGSEITNHQDVLSGFQIDYGVGNTGKELIIANVYFYKADAPCTVKANREDLDECRVLSVLGTTTYTPIGISEKRGWSGESGEQLTIGTKGANNVWHISNGTASALHMQIESNVQPYNKIHLEVWTGEAMNIQFGLLCWVSGFNESVGGEAYQKQTISTNAAQWTSVDYTLTSLTTSAYLANATDLYFYDLASKNVYVTNVYFYNDDATKPVVVSATNSGVTGTDLTLTLTATYKGATLKDFRITNTTTSDVYERTADGSNQVTIPDINYCETYDLDIQAIYNSCILSDITDMEVFGNAMAANTALIAPTTTVHADVEPVTYTIGEAIDGNTGSRWSSGGSEPNVSHWYKVDLGSAHDVASWKIAWETACPKDYYIEGSLDDTHYYPIKHETTVPANAAGSFSDYDNYAFAAAVGVRYLRVRSITNNTGYGLSIWEMQAYGQCYSESAKPVATFGRLDSQAANGTNTAVNAQIEVGAYDAVTAYESMYYRITYTPEGGVATVLDNQTATSGIITLSDLEFSTTYTVRVEARDGNNGNLSDNYVEFSFTTPDNEPTLYFRNSINWQDAGLDTDYRFSYVSPGSAVMTYTTPTLETNDLQYRPYNDANNNLAIDDDALPGGGFCTPGNQFINGKSGSAVTFFAKDKEHFVSNADLVYVIGTAVEASENIALPMTLSGNTYYWEGPVKSTGGTYQVIVKAQESNNIAAAAFTTHSKARIMNPTSWTNTSGWTKAKLTFDMETWTCTWEESTVDVCAHEGDAGYGLTINGASLFTGSETYAIQTYMTGGKWIVRASTTNISGMNAILQPFTNAAATLVQEITKIGQANDTVLFVVDPSVITYKENNIVHYTVKIEGAAGLLRQTDIHYYDFSGSGECAPDYFDIYHYDDAPDGKRTSYAGGTILQPIRYFRHFEHTDWCALSVPFDVAKVVVEDEGEWPLFPRFTNNSGDVEGYYWLKTFSGEVTLPNFKGAWQQLSVATDYDGMDGGDISDAEEVWLGSNVVPAKNTPYVISFPNGSYYGSHWVIFYGAAGQTIASSEDAECGTSISLTSGDYEYEKVKLQRNNMMKPTGSKTTIYTLDEGDDYYTRKTTTIPAFESYVIGTKQVQRRYSILRPHADSTPDPDTTTDLEDRPTTAGWKGEIYTSMGVLVATFADRDAMERSLDELTTGVYVVRCGKQVNKVVVP